MKLKTDSLSKKFASASKELAKYKEILQKENDK